MDIWTNAKNPAIPIQTDTSADPGGINPTTGIYMLPNSETQQAVRNDGAYGEEIAIYDGSDEVQWDHVNYIRCPHHMRA